MLLSVRDLTVAFDGPDGPVTAVDGISLDLAPGEALGLVGESGCGKSVTALALQRLVRPPGRVAARAIRFEGEDLATLPERRLRDVRGRRIGMVFQEPMTSLNPVFTIGRQIAEPLRRHERLPAATARRRAVELLDQVGIPEPARRAGDYPHQLSGGMRQRAMIAMALACRPRLLIADEPTTALDVTVQAQILDILRRLRRDLGMAVIFITHDLGVIAEFVDRVAVMYAGRIVEEAPVGRLFEAPAHPYTEGLMASIPPLDTDRESLETIPGIVPPLDAMPAGCRFHPRCPAARPVCTGWPATLLDAGPGQRSACLRVVGYASAAVPA